MQLIVHSPYGSRINRAWGLALRKRFCRKFNFELQAAATEDNIVISLTQAHSFALEEVARYLHSNSVRTVLTQALLDSPMFTTRWRWVIGVALALPRFRGGKKVPPQLARMGAEDLIGAVFPDQIACAENLAGEREIPDHPLVRQAIGDSLTEAMDIDGLERLLRGIESGAVRITVRDLTQPSPLALEVLSARPYAYLDDAPLEERRTQAVMARRWMSPQQASDLGRLDPEAIARVRSEAWPEAENADELHDALVWLGFLTSTEVAFNPRWSGWLVELAAEKRAAHFDVGGSTLWIAAERLPHFRALWPKLKTSPMVAVPPPYDKPAWSREDALVEIVRGRLEGLGPVVPDELARCLGLTGSEFAAPLAALETEGFAMRGRFTAEANGEEWCERRLLSRIHHYTLKRLRAEIEPVAARDFLRFLFDWQHLSADARMTGPKALDHVVAQLEGFEAPAAAWESDILPARLVGYESVWLDERCLAGQLAWMRLRTRNGRNGGKSAPVRSTPIALLPRRHAGIWMSANSRDAAPHLSFRAQLIADCIKEHGASFFDELMDGSGLLRSQIEEGLAELVALGLVTSDSFGGLRALLVPSSERRTGTPGRRRRRAAAYGVEDAGRWAMVRRPIAAEREEDATEHVARTLLARYGVVFWRLLEREAARLPAWRELLRVYRRLESRGEIRGGRFVAGFSGEQFALPEAIGRLRGARQRTRGRARVANQDAEVEGLREQRELEAAREAAPADLSVDALIAALEARVPDLPMREQVAIAEKLAAIVQRIAAAHPAPNRRRSGRRMGARRMLAQVLIAEADCFVAMWKDLKLPDGRDRVVRHGHGPHRAIQTGVGPVEVRRAKVRDQGRRGRRGENPLQLVDPAEMGAADEEFRCAVAGSLPAWGVDRRLPGGARRALRQGRAEPVASGDLAADGRMADGLRRLAEARPLGAAIRVRVGGRGVPASPDGRRRRMHAGADRRNTRGQEGTRRHLGAPPSTSDPPPRSDIPSIRRATPFGRSTKSQAAAYSRVLACASLRHHSATVKQYCPSSSAAARHSIKSMT